jgi:flagellar hook-associated protein FlgK
MNSMQISAIALAGMYTAQTKLEHAATCIAHVSDAEDHVDLSAEFVTLMESRNDFAANLKVLKTADQIEQSVLGILPYQRSS